MRKFCKKLKKDAGAALPEFALILALIAVVAIPSTKEVGKCVFLNNYSAAMALAIGESCSGGGIGSEGCSLAAWAYVASHPSYQKAGLTMWDIIDHTC